MHSFLACASSTSSPFCEKLPQPSLCTMRGVAAAPTRGVGPLSSAGDVKGALTYHLRRVSAGAAGASRGASRRSLSCRARVTAPSEGQRQQESGQQDGDPARPIGSRRGRRAAHAPAKPQSHPGDPQGATLESDQEAHASAPAPAPAVAPTTHSSAPASASASDSDSDSDSPSATATATASGSTSQTFLPSEGGPEIREPDALPLPLDEAARPGSEQNTAEAQLSVASPEVAEVAEPPSPGPLPFSGMGAPAAPGAPAAWQRTGAGDVDPDEEALEGLVVCVGEPVVEFVPSVRASTRQAPDEVFAAWRSMQWVAPDFARAPGATSCQVAHALGRMGVPVAFLGALGEDPAGQRLKRSLEAERVRTEGLVVTPRVRTSVSHLRLPSSFHSPPPAQLLADKAALQAEEAPLSEEPGSGAAGFSPQAQGAPGALAPAQEDAEEEGNASLLASIPKVLPLLHEATWVHCTSLPFTSDDETGAFVERCLDEALGPAPASASDSGEASAIAAAATPQAGRARLFLDVNLPLLLWRSKGHAWGALSHIWPRASVIELSRAEAEFLIGEEPYVRRREARCQYAAESHSQLRAMHDDYHHSRREVAPLWERGTRGGGALELLIITDGTVLVHYYTRDFDGSVDGTEDVLVAALTCDRAGSGDALVAGLMRKLLEEPEILQNQDRLERAIRYAISAGVISQWTSGAVRSFPTAEATQNLTEQMFLSTLV